MIYKTLKKIDEAIGRINTHPEYSRSLAREVFTGLIRESDKHSSNLEIENEDSPTNKQVAQKRSEYIKNLSSARAYLAEHGFDKTTFAVLGSIVEPRPNIARYFRSGEVTFGDLSGIPPERILSAIDNLCYFLNERTDIHPVIRASQAHIELIRIHPYGDGNGRTARLVQNFALEQRGYTPAIITQGHRELYLGLLNKTLKDRASRESQLEKPSFTENLFHEFIASQVLNSAEHLETMLRSNRVFEIELSGLRGKGLSYTMKGILSGFQSMTNGYKDHETHVHLDSANSRFARYSLRGNIGSEEIKAQLNRYTKRYGFKYTVTPKG